jgi:hypothetical protein
VEGGTTHPETLQSRHQWDARLSALAVELARFCADIEGEFVRVGGKLQEFSERAGVISVDAADIAATLGDGGTASPSRGLEQLVDRLEIYFESSGREMGDIEGGLDKMLGGLSVVDGEIGAFMRLVRMLRILGISTRIESARLTRRDTGFDTLSEDVIQLAKGIEHHLEIMTARKLDLRHQISATLMRIASVHKQRGATARDVLTETRGSVVSLRHAHARSAEAATGVAALSGAVSSHIRDVVTSMQFHDITRQQIEHVRDALLELRSSSVAATDAPGAAEVAAGCELQSAQLELAEQTLLPAAGKIGEALRRIVTDVIDLSLRAREIAGSSGNTGGSMLERLEKRLSPAIGRLLDEAEASRGLSTVLREVATEAETMAGFMSDIEQIGSKIEMVALNASVKAAHTGEEGAALGVLAEALARLCADTRHQSERASSALRSLLAAAEQIGGGLDAGHSRESAVKAEEFGGELLVLTNSLRDIDQKMTALLTRMDTAVRALSADIDATLRRYSAPEMARAVLGPAVRNLRSTGQAARAAAPSGTGQLDLGRIAARYTTGGERSVHDALTGAAAAGQELAASGAAPAAGSEFGDNVELF